MKRRQFVRVLQKLHLWDEGKRLKIISAKAAAYWDFVQERESPKNHGKSLDEISFNLLVGESTLDRAIKFFKT